jgi:hypothetical protein
MYAGDTAMFAAPTGSDWHAFEVRHYCSLRGDDD